MQAFNLPMLIHVIKQSEAWTKGELDALILQKNVGNQIVLTAIHGGTEIISFQSNDSITFQIIEGTLLFHSVKESVSLEKGHLLTLHDNINYRLSTNEETIFLSTILTRMIKPSENN